MPATVIHCRYAAGIPAAQYVYCGRPGPWGNHPGQHATHRTEAIRLYAEWFYAPEQATFRAEARAALTDKILGCWCAPKPCHAAILALYVNAYAPAH